jgi:hypothetical protein
MKNVSSLRSLLDGAGKLPHGDRSLRDHLVGTFSILRGWGAPPSVARAGLIHSVYSTQYYRLALVAGADRHEVQRAAGKRAERLAHAFCTVDRAGLWQALASSGSASRAARCAGAAVVFDSETIYSLLLIEMANIAEQSCSASSLPAPWMHWVLGWRRLRFPAGLRPLVLQLRGALTEDAETGACLAYSSWFRYSRRDTSLLLETTRRNGLAPEPHLLLAAAWTAQRNMVAARNRLQRAMHLFSVWHTSWDKRLPITEWLKLGQRLERALAQPDPALQQRVAATVLAAPSCAQLRRSAPIRPTVPSPPPV